ncbi:unnamed protein product [Nippostrongylus brasiliensis]|uniref:Liprin-beta (inferred by orthology to a C. elegans protein) n=1 Tax=Nippostrongylus brasiliensis TaxID=27835 RepID=A0A158QXN6_NIPBR|nr:unnamed protein product [Nippostrongylus brasiliensis]
MTITLRSVIFSGSDGSSEVESPPSDIPTSSSSLFNQPKIYCDFVKVRIFIAAIEEHAITERPDLETQLKIMQWLVGSTVAVLADILGTFAPSLHTSLSLHWNSYDYLASKAERIGRRDDSWHGHESIGDILSSSRVVLPYLTQHSDSGFGSALSSGSSCSYLPPPPPYRMRSKQHKIHRSFSDSKYSIGQQSAVVPIANVQRRVRGARWNSQCSLSPSPSMSTVSCPEYPELQEKLHRLAMARDSLSLQVSVLSEQVGAQKEKIRDLEAMLAVKRSSITSSEELLHGKYPFVGEVETDSKKLNLMAEVSSLKLKFATLEQEKNEAERKLKMSQNEIDYMKQSVHGKAMPNSSRSQANGGSERAAYLPALRENHLEKQGQSLTQRYPSQVSSRGDEELEQLRHTVHRLLADNEQKNNQIKSLRNALELRSRSQQDEFYVSPRWPEQPAYDLNSQIRRLLLEEPAEPMTHSTSFPVRLCSSSYNRATIQASHEPSSSFTSSISTASSYHSWSQGGNRHLCPTIPGPRSERSCRSPSSPAARQLAAELDELRRLGNESHQNQPYSTASLPRGMGHKASSTLALPTKKYSMTHVCTTSAVESDDEVARGGRSAATSSREEKRLIRDRTRSSIRNLFKKLTRSTSQEQNGASLKKAVELFPPLSQFVDWKSEQLAEWMGEVGFAQYVPEVAKYVRSGRHFLNMNYHEYEVMLGIKNTLHRKRLGLLLRKIQEEVDNPAYGWDIQKTQKWLEDIGLPQYKDVFTENMIDGLMFSALTAADLVEMRVLNAHHFLCICRSIEYLKMIDFKTEYMVRSFDESIVSSYPHPEAVVHWTHAATCEWLRKIDLAEFTPNLLCAGTPGALMVYEPTFTAETLAEILQMPSHKTLLRRHLTTHFNQLLGQKIVAEKRDTLAAGTLPQLAPGMRVKIAKKGLSLSRKKSKAELCIEPDELLCKGISSDPVHIASMAMKGEEKDEENLTKNRPDRASGIFAMEGYHLINGPEGAAASECARAALDNGSPMMSMFSVPHIFLHREGQGGRTSAAEQR